MSASHQTECTRNHPSYSLDSPRAYLSASPRGHHHTFGGYLVKVFAPENTMCAPQERFGTEVGYFEPTTFSAPQSYTCYHKLVPTSAKHLGASGSRKTSSS